MTRTLHEPPKIPFGWWSVLLVVGVLAVNAASVWEIAMALRVLRDHGERTLELATEARARSLEDKLAAVTADLGFLAGSLSLSPEVVDGTNIREEFGPALLLFLRGHPEVSDLILRRANGDAVLEAGRPRGVPGCWTPGPDAPRPIDPRSEGLLREFEIAPLHAGSRLTHLEAALDPGTLLRDKRDDEGLDALECRLHDGSGRLLAGGAEWDDAGPLETAAVAEFAASGWRASGPWSLDCRSASRASTDQLAPVVARHRTMILLNLSVMGLAGALGTYAFRQARRRQQLEDRAAADARVRELERQLFHAERLGTVGRLAAGMAHEINNPLEGMANYLRLSSESLRQGDPAAARRYLAGVQQGLDGAAGIVSRVLDYANPANPPRTVVEIPEILARTVDFVRSRDEFAALRFESDFREGDCRSLASAVMLGQVFLNLILNACEAQPDGGEVLVRCLRVDDSVVAEVADRGPGIPPARRVSIFEPFETTKRSAGLGLSICHSIVQQHGGDLTVYDREGGGSVFRVRLNAVDGGANGPT